MSAQFGRWNIDGRPAAAAYLQKARDMLAPYGPDGEGTYIKDSVGILFRAFHTTKESRRETQPHITPTGAILTWDGRLDNRPELIGKLKDVLTVAATDVEIVAAAFDRWGTDCFAKLIGDWALAIWNPTTRSLVLAKDFVGTRHLYYSVDKDQITWSTILDPLVLLAGKCFALEEEYIAGWLSFFPATHLTPYVGIHAVPASCFVRLEPERQTIRKYWDFDSSKKIRYETDGEYEEHFRQVFAESVRRRMRSDSPILAELSGGMDSSSIVCMADTIIASDAGVTESVDTISYYDDSEPTWNERPYFTKVEEKRGRIGAHIDVGPQQTLKRETGSRCFEVAPGSRRQATQANRQIAACVASGRYRIILSGIGGDEVTGGVPSPDSELQDLLVRAQLLRLSSRLKVWALNKRKPWFHLLLRATKGFFPPSLVGNSNQNQPAACLDSEFCIRHASAVSGYASRLRVFGPLPSFQEGLTTLNALRRQLACSATRSEPPQEKLYPYLDRDLLEFLYAIPREQLVRPGQRRSLVRRALAGIVPREVLDRRRKAFGHRSAMRFVSAELSNLVGGSEVLACESFGIINRNILSKILRQARQCIDVPVVTLTRAIGIEAWLRGVSDQGLVNNSSKTVSARAWQPMMEHRQIRCRNN